MTADEGGNVVALTFALGDPDEGGGRVGVRLRFGEFGAESVVYEPRSVGFSVGVLVYRDSDFGGEEDGEGVQDVSRASVERALRPPSDVEYLGCRHLEGTSVRDRSSSAREVVRVFSSICVDSPGLEFD